MDSAFLSLLNGSNDHALIEVTFERIEHAQSGGVEPDEYSFVFSAWQCHRIVSSGGLLGVFDPVYDVSKMRQSLAQVGANRAAAILGSAEKALSHIPPREHSLDRVLYLENVGIREYERLRTYSRQFLTESRHIQRSVATFIRNRQAEFGRLRPTRHEVVPEVPSKCPEPTATVEDVVRWAASAEIAIEMDDGEITELTLSPKRNSTNQELSDLSTLDVTRQLRAVCLADTYVSELGFASIGAWKSLEAIEVSSTDFRGTWLSHVSRPEKLEEMNFSSTDTCDLEFANVGRLSALREVHLSSTRMTLSNLSAWIDVASLRALNASSCPVTRHGMECIGQVTQLEELWLDGTPVDSDGVRELASLTRLYRLALDHTPIDDLALRTVGKLKNLKVLSLFGTKVTDSGVAWLRDLGLEDLTLTRTGITDCALVHLRTLGNLKELGLDSTAITDEGLAQLECLKHLRWLSLAGTEIDGSGLRHLEGLEKLKYLHLPSRIQNEPAVLRFRKEMPSVRLRFDH